MKSSLQSLTWREAKVNRTLPESHHCNSPRRGNHLPQGKERPYDQDRFPFFFAYTYTLLLPAPLHESQGTQHPVGTDDS